ncbi:exodeoxyribonuclease V subunit gamma [Geobacter sp. AOG2]|uniref:exodeoxyribonuclease V subunit gamma n=1 Tax=Geobacter sp. AOG2 TaxID=1566347 RepID=UPI001CC73DB2|nr:exodeoxyribonuclease V subunit gamma [Geobacter sp. AOG2]GFE60609.1 RecBCD enzyme subunit RecC [Geobacter sp. AOG2]
MGILNVITSSSLQRLIGRMAADFAVQTGSPLAPETVVVQSSGMARWIAMELARLNGISANLRFPFPNEQLEEIFRAVLPDITSPSPFAPDVMAWRIMAALPELLDRPGFEPLRRYCSGRRDSRALLQLSRTIADTFDQYTIFRPEALLAWDRGDGDNWQPQLWRAVSFEFPGQHRAALLRRFRERLAAGPIPAGRLPGRFNLFGISYLPPFHLEAISLLTRIADVRFYLLNPCGEYWGDIISRKRQADLLLRPELPVDADEYFETGNPLLSSLGTLGQEFFSMLLDSGADTENMDEGVTLPTGASLLSLIQADILELRDRSSGNAEKGIVAANDNSIRVNSCHNPMREMEVLYDNLLAMFQELPSLEPRQVVVMTPDIETYAPYISAVFGAGSGDRPAIPYTIADQSQRRDNPAIETFLRILALPSSRFGINRVLELLESPHVMARFSLTSDELQDIRSWLRDSGVRWGLDRDHRSSLGFPPFAENSWQTALDRMFLGYAMVPDHNRLFGEMLPYPGIEGTRATALGKLAGFMGSVREAAALLGRPHTLVEWAECLASVADSLLSPVEAADTGLKPLHEAFGQLKDMQEKSGFSTTLDPEALTDHLTTLLDRPGASYGFLGGRVTFCAMLPMRSIPFRVVCLTGMNDGVFPRVKRSPGFSLLAGKRRRGDRSLRDEDRYLFLEALMSATERLYISYTGQSERDNSELPPSVAVSELLDYVKMGFVTDGSGGEQRPPAVATHHRLQGFNPAYFNSKGDGALFSYAQGTCKALETRRTAGRRSLPFIAGELPEPDGTWREVELDDLIRFFTNPAAYFLALRLGIRPVRPGSEAEEREAFSLDGLTGFNLKQEMVALLLEGNDCRGLYTAARAASRLPPLAAGQVAFDRALDEARGFRDRLAPHLADHLAPLPFSLELGAFKLSGTMNGIRRERLLRYRCARLRSRDRLALWIEHLALCCAPAHGYPRESLLVCRDSMLSLPPLEDAARLLEDLLDIYGSGLRCPLPFFPETSYSFLKKGQQEAQRSWFGAPFSRLKPESADPAFTFCFGRNNPLEDTFEQLAERVFGPFLTVAREGAP